MHDTLGNTSKVSSVFSADTISPNLATFEEVLFASHYDTSCDRFRILDSGLTNAALTLSHSCRQHGAIPAQMREQLGALERVVQSLLEQVRVSMLSTSSYTLDSLVINFGGILCSEY